MDSETPPDPEDNPFPRVVGPWEQVIEDMKATADRYREAGWEVVELHPGDVHVMTGEPRTLAEQQEEYEPPPQRLGLDVVVPGDEYDHLRDVVAGREFDSDEVFRATEGGIVFLLIGLESRAEDAVVFVPAYYELADVEDLRRVAAEHGLYTNVRPLTGEEVVTFTHADPGPMFPDPDQDQ
jgi:hypothetical protein